MKPDTTPTPPVLPIVYIPETLLDRTAALLASFAEFAPCEGVVYWFGLEGDEVAVVTTLVVPDADTSGGDVVTSAGANAEALTAIVDTPLVLLGQAHSHPGSNVRHSNVDDCATFAQSPGALSVVVPYFGFYGADIARCGVHRHLDGAYRWIAPKHTSEHLVVLPGVRDFRREVPAEPERAARQPSLRSAGRVA